MAPCQSMASKRRPGAPADLEELRPGLFAVHNPAAGPTLRGDGEREGDRFRLTTWRREGLLARLRGRGFEVLTLADRIAGLPALPLAEPPGRTVLRPLASGEQINYFAARPLGWQPVPTPPDNPATALLRAGWVIRRRRGRGPWRYALVAPAALRPLGEDEALRHGYATAALEGPAPLTLIAEERGGWRVPDLPLPTEHRQLLGRIATRVPGGWVVSNDALDLVVALLGRLGLTVER